LISKKPKVQNLLVSDDKCASRTLSPPHGAQPVGPNGLSLTKIHMRSSTITTSCAFRHRLPEMDPLCETAGAGS